MRVRGPLEAADVRAKGKGYVIGLRQCSGPGCSCRVSVKLADGGKRSSSTCDGSSDPSGLGCGTRVFWPVRMTEIWIQDHCAERELTTLQVADQATSKRAGGLFNG